ncbi:hypothetical protein PS3A_18800 [Pseudomonas sp. 3A(2025)]
MANNSVESLLAWMKEGAQTYEWDAIIALSGDSVNESLQREYTRRLSEGREWRLADAVIEIPDTQISYHFQGIRIGPPLLSFALTGFEQPDTALRLPIQGGTALMVSRFAGIDSIVKVTAYDLRNGPQLRLELQPSVDGSGVSLDLAEGRNARLDFSGSGYEQQAGGSVLLDALKALQIEQRRWAVASFAQPDNPFLLNTQISVRSQARPDQLPDAQTLDRQGALLLFTTLQYGVGGGYPGNESSFRYLIPDEDTQTYSATALLSSHLLHRAALGVSMQSLLDEAAFDYEPASSAHFGRMVARSGRLEVPAGTWRGPDLEFESDAFTLQAVNGARALTAEFQDAAAVQTWQCPCELTVRYRPLDGGDWSSHTGLFDLNIEYDFHLAHESSAPAAIQGHLFVPYALREEAVQVHGTSVLAVDTLEQIEGFAAYTVKRALLGRFARALNVSACSAFIGGFQAGGGQVLQPLVQALPYDYAAFGRLASPQASFHIVEREPQVSAGASVPLSTEPAVTGLVWAVQHPPGGTGNPGHIDDSGVYHAPRVNEMVAPLLRVLLSATDPATGELDVVVLTVLSVPVSISPLITVVGRQDTVNLFAHAPPGQSLTWSIKNPVPGESGLLEPGDDPVRERVYQPTRDIGDKAVLLDEIEVRNPGIGQTGSAWVLVRHREQDLIILPDEEQTGGADEIQLQAFFGPRPQDVTWSLPLDGPGSITPEGLYKADPASSASFVLIYAARTAGTATLHGDIILPLPLQNFPDVLKRLARRPVAQSD